MENLRSMSCRDEKTKVEGYDKSREAATPISMQDLRCYSANYADYRKKEEGSAQHGRQRNNHGQRSSSAKNWTSSDAEIERKRRLANYRAYKVEGKMKGSLRKSLKWMRNTYSQAIHGWSFK